MIRTFPNFTKLTLEHKVEYDKYVGSLPPISSVSFVELMTWWRSQYDVFVSILNGNLVIQYWRHGVESESGLSIIGRNEIDESICIIFDHLKSLGQAVQLVHVPDFVLAGMRFHDLFLAYEQRNSREYVLPVKTFYPIDNLVPYRQRKIIRLLDRIKPENIEVKSLNLLNPKDIELLKVAASAWWSENINDYGRTELEAFYMTLESAAELQMDNIAIFVHGHLHGFVLFKQHQNQECAILLHLKATHRSTLSHDLTLHLLMKELHNRGVQYLNLSTDEGVMAIRMFILSLGPSKFYHKYRIIPAHDNGRFDYQSKLKSIGNVKNGRN